MKIASIVGRRPHFVKSAAVSEALRAAGIAEVVIRTGRHDVDELSQAFFYELGLKRPKYELDLSNTDPDWIALAVVETLFAERPDLVLVYGDSSSTLAGARGAIEAGIPLVHVEAGLRSGDATSVDERTRIEVDRVSSVLFCPTDRSDALLRHERVRGQIYVVGDVLADSLHRFRKIARQRHPIFEPDPYVVATIERDENLSQPRLGKIVEGLNRLGGRVILPASLRMRSRIRSERLHIGPHIRVVKPLTYLRFISLLAQARVVVTDSGGVLREAYWSGVPCVILRASTEWGETVAAGASLLADDDPDEIEGAVRTAPVPNARSGRLGDGRAAKRIAEALVALGYG